MATTLQGVMKTEVVFSDDKTERFLLCKEWSANDPTACLIMIHPSTANEVTNDATTGYAIANLLKLGFGRLEITNITSAIVPKLDTKKKLTLSDENMDYILKSAEKSDKVILAWGKIGENNKRVSALQMKLLRKLSPFKDKLYVIANESGDMGFHPLAPQIRFHWELVKFVRPAYLQEKPEGETPADKPNTSTGSEFTDPLPDELWTQNKGKNSRKETKPA